MGSLFHPPQNALLSALLQSFPGREGQIRSLATLLHPDAAPCRNLVIYGTESTGKSSVTSRLLACLAGDASLEGRFGYAVIDVSQPITSRHLFEHIFEAVTDSLPNAHRRHPTPPDPSPQPRCESLAQLAVALEVLLKVEPPLVNTDTRSRPSFLLALDNADKSRDGPATLLPALARLSEKVPCLSCLFILTCPPAGFLRATGVAHLLFPAYSKTDLIRILALTPPEPLPGASQQETSHLWLRFCAAVHDSLARPASRTLPSLRRVCGLLWPRFTAPVVAGTHSATDFARLLMISRAHLRDESLLVPSILSAHSRWRSSDSLSVNGSRSTSTPVAADLTALLPITARLLLLSAYLASHNASRHDLALFSTHDQGRQSRRRYRRRQAVGLAPGPRATARKLLGSQAFSLERMMAIFQAVRNEWAPVSGSTAAAGLDGDLAMAIATLASLRLLVRVGPGDMMDRAGKWRITISWEAVKGVGRSIGLEVQDWLID